MTKPFQIEGGQKQFFSGQIDKVIESWLYIESQLQLGITSIPLKFITADSATLNKIVDNYRSLGWKVVFCNNTSIEFNAENLPFIHRIIQVKTQKVTELRKLVETGSLVYDYEGSLLDLVPDYLPTTYPDLTCYALSDGSKGRLKIIDSKHTIEAWYKYVKTIYYDGQTYFVFKL